MKRHQRTQQFCCFAIFYSFWIITLTTPSVAAQEDIPQLNITEPFIELKENDTVYIKCSGKPPLQWQYIDPTLQEFDKAPIDIEADHEITLNSYGNESIIRLTFHDYVQTGKYLCSHSVFNSSVYIFVDGGGELLLPVTGSYINFLYFDHGVPDIIPCLPTVPNANVTLWKFKRSSEEYVPLEFDPTIGFTLRNPTDDYQSVFRCFAEYGNRNSSLRFEVEITKPTGSIPQVYISLQTENDVNYVLVGSNFRLICIVQLELNTLVEVNWAFPSKDKNRAVIKELPYMKSNAYKNVTKELRIVNATKSDEGSYQCNATDHSKRVNYAEVIIKIYETPQKPKVYFDPNVTEEIIKSKGETVQLIAHYEVFPPSKDIRELWTKDKMPIVPSLEKHIKPAEKTFSLEISNLKRNDSGLYTVNVTALGGYSEKSFLLRVKDIPELTIEKNTTCCYVPRKKYVLLCKTRGYPPPKISWSWRPYCLNSSSECNPSIHSDTWEKFKNYYSTNNSTVTTVNKDETISSKLAVVAEESGFYKCKSENSIGKVEEEITFIASDADNGFQIVSENLAPEVKTNFSALCKASSLLYTNLSWIRDLGNETVVISTGVLVNSNVSNTISLQLELNEITKSQTGTYICLANMRYKRRIERMSVNVEVQDTNIAAAAQGSQGFMMNYGLYIFLPILAILLLIYCVYKAVIYITRKKSKMLRMDFNHHLFQEGRMALFDPNLPLDDQVDLLPYDEKWEFPKEKLKLGRTVGQGAFGRVVKAEAFGINDFELSTIVAVKMLKERADSNQQKALMDELKILIHLGHHVNIVNLMGAVTKNIPRGELMVIVEYCRYGNIRHYLHRHRDSFIDEMDSETGRMIPVTNSIYDDSGFRQVFISEPTRTSTSSSSGVFAVDNPSYRQTMKSTVSTNPRGSTSSHTVVYSTSGSSNSSGVFRNYSRADSQEHIITTSDLLCYAFQCARGMEYLTSRKLIHRDLAARNVLLADDKVVKICDFGLAKDCYKYSNYVKKGDGPLPIKWMSIESIWDHVFTSKSDVWSFGILMWEFFTLGGNPYPGVEIDEEFYKKLKAGYRMEKPELCPDFVYQIMTDCWHANPDERPNFNQISDMLGDYLEDPVKQHYIDLNESYMEMNRKMNVPDYSNVVKLESDELQRDYVNSEINNDILAYDIPLGNRSVTNAPIPKEPMEVVPMIQLETISEGSSNVNHVSKNIDLLQVIEPDKLDYLQMGRTCEDITNMKSQAY